MAELVEVSDDGGNTISMKMYNGHQFPTRTIGNVKDHLESIKNMRIKSDDVFLLSFPRSGTHWVREIVSMLQRREASYIDEDVSSDIPIDMVPIETLDKMESPRVLYTHLYFQYLPRQLNECKCKVIHVTRNPKDNAVSNYELMTRLTDPEKGFKQSYNGTWQHFLKMYCNGKMATGCFIDYHQQIEEAAKNHPIHTVHFESLKQDPLSEIRKIADYLEVPYTDNLLRNIAEKCQFKELQKEKTENMTDFLKEISVNGDEIIYRKGEIGDWKNWFTVAQNEAFDKWFQEKMKGCKFTYQF